MAPFRPARKSLCRKGDEMAPTFKTSRRSEDPSVPLDDKDTLSAQEDKDTFTEAEHTRWGTSPRIQMEALSSLAF